MIDDHINIQNAESIQNQQPIKIGRLLIGFICSFVLAVISFFLLTLLLSMTPVLVFIIYLPTFFLFLVFALFFVFLNSIAFLVLRKYRSFKAGVLIGYILILLIFVLFYSSSLEDLISKARYAKKIVDAEYSGDVNYCNRLGKDISISVKNRCYKSAATEKDDPSICEKILRDSILKRDCYDLVYVKRAVTTQDVSNCSKVKGPIYISICYQTISKATKNYALCQKMYGVVEGPQQDPQNEVDYCYKNFLLNYPEPNYYKEICPLIKDAKFKKLAKCPTIESDAVRSEKP